MEAILLVVVEYAEPEFLPWDGRRVPMTFLAGYLGAGKTTLINQLLTVTERPIAVLVNDVGAVNIDASLIKRRHGDTIELTDGCVCCSLSEGFAAAIDGLRNRPTPPDHVVIELSGVADPARVVPWSRSAGFRLDGVVTLVDVDQFEARLADPVAALTITAQIEVADLLVATKLDLADQPTIDAARARLAELNPGTPIIEVDATTDATGGDTAAALLDLGARHPEGTAVVPEPTLFDRHRTVTVPLPDPIERDELTALLADLDTLVDLTGAGAGHTIVRAKGIARHHDGTSSIIQVVGARTSITDLPAPEQEPATDLVVISIPTGS